MSTITQVCTRCGQPTDHSASMPIDRNPVTWEAYIAEACNSATSQDRIEQAVSAGVNFSALIAIQTARHSRN